MFICHILYSNCLPHTLAGIFFSYREYVTFILFIFFSSYVINSRFYFKSNSHQLASGLLINGISQKSQNPFLKLLIMFPLPCQCRTNKSNCIKTYYVIMKSSSHRNVKYFGYLCFPTPGPGPDPQLSICIYRPWPSIFIYLPWPSICFYYPWHSICVCLLFVF